jgi:hypothetical protein
MVVSVISPFQGLQVLIWTATQGCALGYRMLAFQAKVVIAGDELRLNTHGS